MRIEIVNWDKFNPRKDLRSMPWVRLQNDIAFEPKLFGLTAEQKWVWIFLLSYGARENKGAFELGLSYICHYCDVSPAAVQNALDHFQSKQMITIVTNGSDRITNESVRIRKVTPTVTNGSVSNGTERNGRNETNGTNEFTEGVSDDTAHRNLPALTETPKPPKKAKAEPPTKEAWLAYREAYYKRYGHDPVQNATTNGQMSQLVKRLGQEAPDVIRFFLTHDNAWYVRQVHAIGCCLKDAEPLRTQWAANHRVTSTAAHDMDKRSEQADVFARVSAKLKAEGYFDEKQ